MIVYEIDLEDIVTMLWHYAILEELEILLFIFVGHLMVVVIWHTQYNNCCTLCVSNTKLCLFDET